MDTEMFQLRKNLKETQAHLFDRDRKFHALQAEFNKLKKGFEKTEAENRQLREAMVPGGDVVVLSRAQKDEAENRFLKTSAELHEKTKECEALLLELRTLKEAAAARDITEAQVVMQFTELRERIRSASKTQFDELTPINQIPTRSRNELEQLSSTWKYYMSSEMGSYLLRTLIWRYIHSALFMKVGKVWGQRTKNALSEFSDLVSPKVSEGKVSDAEYQRWRIETGQLLHKAFQFDDAELDGVGKQIYDATRQIAMGKSRKELGMNIQEIVKKAAELCDTFARSHYEALMSELPGSDPTKRSLAFKEEMMEIVAKKGTQPVVDMMVTPCLIKKGGDGSVIVKAEVIC